MFNRIRKTIETLRGKPTPKVTALELATRHHSVVTMATRSESKERIRVARRKRRLERVLQEKAKKR